MSAALDLELPFGVAADGRMVPVVMVERGLACNCRCPQCDRRLVAKKGDIIRHHFAHESDAQCSGAFESMLHRLAKQIVADHQTIRLPTLIGFHDGVPTLITEQSRDVPLTNVRLEVWQSGFRPDAIATMPDGDGDLVIEVMVTHACEPQKLERLRARDVAAMEIDLSGYRSGVGESLLMDLVLSKAHRIWLHHPRQWAADAAATAYVRECEAEIARQAEREAEELRAAHARARAYRERLAAERWAAEEAGREVSDTTSAHSLLQRQAGERMAQIEARRMSVVAEAWRLELNELNRIAAVEARARARLAEEERLRQEDASRNLLIADRQLRASERAHALQVKAAQTFGSGERAALWMRSAHPGLNRRSPADVCGDTSGYSQCLSLLVAEQTRARRAFYRRRA